MDKRAAQAKKYLKDHVITKRDVVGDSPQAFTLMPASKNAFGHHLEVRALRWGNLLVYGDWDPVVFGLNSGTLYEHLYRIGRNSIDYAHEKARIGTGSPLESDDVDQWKKDIIEYRREKLISPECAREAIDLSSGEDFHEARNVLYREDFELACSAGMVIDWRVYIAWAACARLCDLLEEEEELNGLAGSGI